VRLRCLLRLISGRGNHQIDLPQGSGALEDKIRVLVVDDEERFALNLVKIFSRRGFDASAVFTGEQAVERIGGGQVFDVVILDIKMPGMDGIKTLDEIKKMDPETEVIMLTGHATLDSGIQAMHMGAYDYLMKPCDTEDLIEKIKEAYERERIRHQPVLWSRNKVGDCTLYSFKKLQPDDPLENAVGLFHRKTYRTGAEAIYIQDPDNRFVGQVTKRDLLHAAEAAHPDRSMTWADILKNPKLLPDKPLRSIMRPEPPLTAAPRDSLTETAHRMILNNIRCMPVVDNGKVIGIVRLQDILNYVEKEIE
jgi:CheY-like chemotaxis protein